MDRPAGGIRLRDRVGATPLSAGFCAGLALRAPAQLLLAPSAGLPGAQACRPLVLL